MPKSLVSESDGYWKVQQLRDYVMEFFLGLCKITKGHTAIRVVVDCCTHKLTHVTLDKVSIVWGICKKKNSGLQTMLFLFSCFKLNVQVYSFICKCFISMSAYVN